MKTILKFILLLFTICLIKDVKAQNITYNHIVDVDNPETQKVMRLFEGHIASNPEKKEKNPYWNQVEQNLYEKFDFLESEFNPSLYMGFPIHVLSIKLIDDLYQIKAQFGMPERGKTPFILAIVNYFAKKENGEYKLYNALTINRGKWNHKKQDILIFITLIIINSINQKLKSLISSSKKLQLTLK